MKVSFFASGELGFITLKEMHPLVDLNFIATDSKSKQIIDYAHQNNIPVFVGNPRNGKLSGFSKDFKCEVALSVNYLFIIEKSTVELFKYPINFHGSLLPKYRGRTPHVWAIINNEKQTGITAHLIDENCDTGNIVLQKKIAIEENDTGQSILEKFKAIYPSLIKEVVELLNLGELKTFVQDDSKATFFDKRTAEDGQIDWDWQKERIYNWVRAQANPYPGAFTFYKDEKIIIDKVSFSDLGFHQKIPNGFILATSPKVIIKTPNGAISLDEIRNKATFFEKGTILNIMTNN